MKKLAVIVSLALLPVSLCAQNTGVGLPAFGSFTGGFDTINNQNLNAYLAIPVASSTGRGISLNLSLVNNSLLWQKVGSGWTPATDSAGNPTWGWLKDFPVGGTLS